MLTLHAPNPSVQGGPAAASFYAIEPEAFVLHSFQVTEESLALITSLVRLERLLKPTPLQTLPVEEEGCFAGYGGSVPMIFMLALRIL